MVVLKFGGTSVGNIEAFEQVINIVIHTVADEHRAARPGAVVVTSAMSGVTNTLIEAARRAAGGDESVYQAAVVALRAKHEAVAQHFITDATQRERVLAQIDERLHDLSRFCSSLAVLGELTQRGLDVISGLGEQMSAPLLAAVLRARGVPAQSVDARELIITDHVHGGAEPLMAQTEPRCRELLLPLVRDGVVPVVTGFIGATVEGVQTTLGRGGTDYSAAIVGAAIDANEVQIWTDVNGVMTADPRVVPNARSINRLTYEEVAELAYYGAKVLHPKTVRPVIEKRIPLRVLNTFEPEHPGTRIVERAEMEGDDYQGRGVKAVTAIRAMNLITVAGRGFMGVPGTAARTFQAVAGANANVMMISQSSSEQGICMVIPAASAEIVQLALRQEFARELARGEIDGILNQPDIVIVAVVGSTMRGTPGLAAGIFSAVATHEINVIAIAQGSSEANISFVLEEARVVEAVQAIHDAFELHKPTAERSPRIRLLTAEVA